ncbi:MAG: hypothetical protein IPO27_15490 [Bacteroidetes bacterium]|nr:hypothetical protein [Bacteroidota bacterium]
MNYFFKVIFIVLAYLGCSFALYAQSGDTTVVQTLRFDSTMRSGVFNFPNDSTKTYEKILMLYSMRCKNGQISTGQNPNLGCGEWDYNCYTYVIDSTQTDSLRSTAKSHIVNNFNGPVYYYTNQPVYQYTVSYQTQVNYLSIISQDSAIIGNGNMGVHYPFDSSANAKTQFLYTAADLTAAGLFANMDITGLRLDVALAGSSFNHLRIRMKHTSASNLSSALPDLGGYQTVYYFNNTIAGAGWKQFNFNNNFNWDGISNVLVEFSYSNYNTGSENTVNSTASSYISTVTSNRTDKHLTCGNNLSLINPGNGFANSISNEITIAFWSKGDSTKIPSNNTTIAEAVGQNNERQINIHMPWSDANIYWDCGNDGSGYDRINKATTPQERSGQWNFWAFTKNALTGEMKIFLNGKQWAVGTGKSKSIDIKSMAIGSDFGHSIFYYGGMDEFSIWNKALDSVALNQIMYKDIDNTHLNYSNLLLYYQLNEDAGNTVVDASPLGNHGNIFNPDYRIIKGADLFRNFSESSNLANCTFLQGTYTTSVVNNLVTDSVQLIPNSIISYTTTNGNLVIVDTTYSWLQGYYYIYNDTSAIIDSMYVSGNDSIVIGTLTYYQKRPMRVELINFITPYGLNLNLNGLVGKTWVFDVTDFAPILKGPRFLAMEDGKYQEDNDITFVYYEGTPPRDVKAMQQIWPSGSWVSPSYTDIVNNTFFEPRDIVLDNTASFFKVRSAISGHGQQGEFVARNHIISLDSTINFTRSVWTECSTNPIYPQGGTWIYDRAGWCPGAAAVTKEYDLTPSVQAGDTITLDYSLPPLGNPGQSNYRVNNQLVTYGAANFNLDASIDFVKAPTTRTEYQRINPLCANPVVVLKNTGVTSLTSATITYGRVGGITSTYSWQGNLAFLDTQEVTLPIPDWASSPSDKFIAYVSLPNGNADMYANNDTSYSTFTVPVQLPSYIYFELKTNNLPGQNNYTLKDDAGNILISRSGLSANTVYRDTVNLVNGCYILRLKDNAGDGLSFWNNPNQGSGYIRVRSAVNNALIRSFTSDFGDNIYFQFTAGFLLPVAETASEGISDMTIFPNPGADLIMANITASQGQVMHLYISDLHGKMVYTDTYLQNQEQEKLNWM